MKRISIALCIVGSSVAVRGVAGDCQPGRVITTYDPATGELKGNSANVPGNDLNGDGKLDISDILLGLRLLFLGGPAPCPLLLGPSAAEAIRKPCKDALASCELTLQQIQADLQQCRADLLQTQEELRQCRLEPACPPGEALPATGQAICLDGNGTEIPCDLDGSCPGQDGAYQAGCPRAGRFVDNGDGTINDLCAGLVWQKNTTELPWCDALSYCETLSLAGHDDWRLPNVNELESLVDFGAPLPNLDPVFNGSGNFWTSTSGSGDAAFRISFGPGEIILEAKSVANHFRAVRTRP